MVTSMTKMHSKEPGKVVLHFSMLLVRNYYVLAKKMLPIFHLKKGNERQSKELISLRAPSVLLLGKPINLTYYNIFGFSCSG